MSTRPFNSFFQSPELARLGQITSAQRQLSTLWKACLPAGLANLCDAVGIEGECLMVSTRSAAILSKLRQMEMRLVQQLNDKGLKINAIRCRIQVELLPHERKAPKRDLTISPSALQTLQDAAENFPPSPLRDAFAAMVKRRQRK